MVAIGYFRFIHKKDTPDKNHTLSIPSTSPFSRLDIPKLETKNPLNGYLDKLPVEESLRTLKRDIFASLRSINEAQNGAIENMLPRLGSTLNLGGTVIGRGSPIAIINDQIVRIGDLIGEYELVSIEKKEVLLASGNKKLKVNMLKNE